jgi:hypothetical protein
MGIIGGGPVIMSIGIETQAKTRLTPNSSHSHWGQEEWNDGHPLSLVRKYSQVALQNWSRITHPLQHLFSIAKPEYLDHLPAVTPDRVMRYLCVVAAGFKNGSVVLTSKTRASYWRSWTNNYRIRKTWQYHGDKVHNHPLSYFMSLCHCGFVRLWKLVAVGMVCLSMAKGR